MTRKFGIYVAVVLSLSALLASCLVTHKTLKSYTISLPAKLPIYGDGQYINFLYDIFLVNGNVQRANGYLQWKWEVTALPKPFTGELITPLMRFVVTEAPDNGENKAVQYISQDSGGAMFLYATEGIGSTIATTQKNSYWVYGKPILLAPLEPETTQLLWSPINDGGSTNIQGVNQAENNAMDFFLTGPCDTTSCPAAAEVKFSDFTVNAGQPEQVETPIGKFEAYRLDYSGTITITANLPQIPLFDFRMSCWKVGEQGTVTFNGSMWIYPPIGPIQIENACIFGNTATYYSAKANKTNISY